MQNGNSTLRLHLVVFLSLGLLPHHISCQSSPLNPAPPPSTLSQARQSFNPGSDIQSIHLVGSAVQQTGQASQSGAMDFTLSAKGESTLTMSLSSGQWTEQWDALNSGLGRNCTRTNPSGSYDMTIPACWLAVNWVFPHLSLQDATRSPLVTLSDGGTSSIDGTTYVTLKGATAAQGASTRFQSLVNRWSPVTISLDPSTLQIASISYSQTPDSGAQIAISTTIRYSDYRPVGSLMVPFHIERAINGSTNLTLTITSVEAN